MNYYAKMYLALAMAGYCDAFFRMSCPGRISRDRVDPIVNPGKIAGHVHTISGGSGFSASMTFQDARASMCSSCEIKEDMSNYWTPQLYVHMKDGTFQAVPVAGDPKDVSGGMTVYYLQRPGNATEKLHAFPEGFRMLAGDTNKRNGSSDLATQGISYACIGANQPETAYLPDYNCPDGLRAQVFFPACWNGRDLDTPDHKSHVSYPTQYNSGYCPDDFPVHMISIFYEILYDTNLFADQWNGTQHPFVFSNGDATGYGLHGDFLNGWDVDVLQNAVDTCNDGEGQVSECKAVTTYSASECQQCQIPTTVQEATGGSLAQLPGCNPITYGPEPAVAGTCNDNTTFGVGSANYIDLTQSKGWEYAGCGSDNIGDRAFHGSSEGKDDMTVPACIDYCSAAGYSYAGLEFGHECWCTNQLDPRYVPKDGIMGSCNYKCVGDASQTCGGWAALSIYHNCAGQSSCSNWKLNMVSVATSTTVSSSSSSSSNFVSSSISASLTGNARRHARQLHI